MNHYWALHTDDLASAQQLLANIEQKLPEMVANAGGAEAESKTYEVTADGTAIIPIRGTLIARDLPAVFARFFGVTSYPALQRQLAEAAADEDVKRIVLDVSSGGGQVSGLADTIELLHQVKAQKPVHTFASDVMASAALWLGSVGSKVAMSKSTAIGSIGAAVVHVSTTKADENWGYKATIIRSGAKKMLGHSAEELSEEAYTEIKRGVDFHHNNFVRDLAQHRQSSVAAITPLADGRMFYGAEAVDANLADEITTFASFISDLEKPKSFYQPSGFAANNSGESTMNLEQAMARISELEAEQEAGKTALAAAETRATAAETELAGLRASNKALADAVAKAESVEATCAQILDNSIAAMANALNAEVIEAEGLENKLAYHAKVKEKFEARFPVGGVAANAQAEAVANQAELPDWVKLVKKG